MDLRYRAIQANDFQIYIRLAGYVIADVSDAFLCFLELSHRTHCAVQLLCFTQFIAFHASNTYTQAYSGNLCIKSGKNSQEDYVHHI